MCAEMWQLSQIVKKQILFIQKNCFALIFLLKYHIEMHGDDVKFHSSIATFYPVCCGPWTGQSAHCPGVRMVSWS